MGVGGWRHSLSIPSKTDGASCASEHDLVPQGSRSEEP